MKRYKHSLSSLFLLQFLAIRSSAEELTLNVNFKQPVSVTNEKFLSLTVDPSALVHGNALRYVHRICNDPKLAPVRHATRLYQRGHGPTSMFYTSNVILHAIQFETEVAIDSRNLIKIINPFVLRVVYNSVIMKEQSVRKYGHQAIPDQFISKK